MRFFSLLVTLGVFGASVIACSSSSNDSGGSSGQEPGTPGGGSPDDPDSSTGNDSAKPVPSPRVSTTHESMQVNGQNRTYELSVPSTYSANKSYPLVMVFHGNPGSAAGMLAALPFDIASGQDAVIAYPDGLGNNWDLSTPIATNEDIAFVRVLAKEIASKYNVDTSRVFGSGYSGGGFFLNQLVCRVPSVFKAFASHAGGAPFKMTGEAEPNGCVACPAGKTPSLHTHGRQDTEVGMDSGYYAAACWGQTNGCSSSDPNGWSDVAPSPCKRAAGCDAKPVELCWVDGLGHTQWSQASQVAWDFFESIMTVP
jgi:polyhydroxybutyrate depolymerase